MLVVVGSNLARNKCLYRPYSCLSLSDVVCVCVVFPDPHNLVLLETGEFDALTYLLNIGTSIELKLGGES